MIATVPDHPDSCVVATLGALPGHAAEGARPAIGCAATGAVFEHLLLAARSGADKELAHTAVLAGCARRHVRTEKSVSTASRLNHCPTAGIRPRLGPIAEHAHDWRPVREQRVPFEADERDTAPRLDGVGHLVLAHRGALRRQTTPRHHHHQRESHTPIVTEVGLRKCSRRKGNLSGRSRALRRSRPDCDREDATSTWIAAPSAINVPSLARLDSIPRWHSGRHRGG